MKAIKKVLNNIFIDGLSGMALGLFSTLIIGTILKQIGDLMGGTYGTYLSAFAVVAQRLTGAGIGIGVAYKFRESTYVLLSAAAAGMIGAYASNLIAGTLLSDTGALVLSGPGEPLGAFVAAYVGITIGRLVAGKTKLDLLITPAITILSGGAVGILVGPGVSSFMTWLGNLVNWGTEQQPILMGIVVSVIMGMVLTLPISSAALGIILGLNGVAAGAATIGCCCQMIGFAVTSFKDNGVGGLFAQGIHGVGQTDGGRGLALTGRGGADGRDEDKLALLRCLMDEAVVYLGLIAAIGDHVLVGEAQTGGDVDDGLHFGFLCDLDVRLHIQHPP